MKVIENPVKIIENADTLQKMAMQVGILMRALEQIFSISQFYREARMVSFLDRLLECISAKIKKKCNIAVAIKASQASEDGATVFQEEVLEGATLAVSKFNEHFFMRKHMQAKSANSKVEEAIGLKSEHKEEEEEESKQTPKQQMEQSFYRKQGLDFLSF